MLQCYICCLSVTVDCMDGLIFICVLLQATVFFDGMRKYYERQFEEVSSQLNFAYRS